MNYELALKLKNAGFPQKEVRFKGTEKVREMFGADEPTLSELIEACSCEFTHLKKVTGGWQAYYNGEDVRSDNHYFFGNGSTPEEAVANLWLELNKKHA